MLRMVFGFHITDDLLELWFVTDAVDVLIKSGKNLRIYL